MNKIILTGNMAKDFEYKVNESGKAFGYSSIAVKRERKNAQGEYDVDFVDFVCWGFDAEYMKTYSSKGARLELAGRLQIRNVEGKKYYEVVVESINCFRKGDEKVSQESETFAYDDAMKNDAPTKNDFDFNDEDLPF